MNKETKNLPLDLSKLKKTSLVKEKRKVELGAFALPFESGTSFLKFWESLPDFLGAKDLKELAEIIARAHKRKKEFILAMGAHPIKVGLSPLIVDFIKRGIISGVAMNGAGAIHDFEIAFAGKTSEEVESAIEDGSFGSARETGEFFAQVSRKCSNEGIGLGEAIGKLLLANNYKNNGLSIVAQAVKRNVPVTVHIAIGTDIIHIHPQIDGGGLGKGSLLDFRIFCKMISRLEGGVFLNLGSAVIMPEVFLKAVSAVRNLGFKLKKFTTVNMDFILHYRPRVNVLTRPVGKYGRGINLIGHHEIMLPLLFAGVLEQLKEEKKR